MVKIEFFLIFIVCSLSLFSINRLEVTVGIGYTAIDFDSLLEKDEGSGTSLDDWDQFAYGVSGQYYFYKSDILLFGTELQLQHMYSYSVLVPSSSYLYNRYYTVNVLSLSPIVRYIIKDETTIDFGPVLTIDFSENIGAGVFVAYSHFFILSEEIIIPLKIRLDIRSGTEVSFPIIISSGMVIAL